MATITDVNVRRVLSKNEHDNQKWFVLEGSIDGFPEVTKRDSISVRSLASGQIVLEDRIAKMKADVMEYFENVQYLKTVQL